MMIKLTIPLLTLVLCLLLIQISIAQSTNQPILEFLYWNPKEDTHFCEECPDWADLYQDFLRKNETIKQIHDEYISEILVIWIEFESTEGQAERQQFQIFQPNSIILKSPNSNVTIIEGNFNYTSVKAIIEAYLQGNFPQSSTQPLFSILALAFYFGFQETFSPCLLALLSFVLSYSLGKANCFWEGFFRIFFFGLGFLISALLFGVTIGLLFLSLNSLHFMITLVVCVFAIIFGLTQLFEKETFKTKPIVRKLSKKYAFSYLGLSLLGLLFYFLDPCIAPIFFALLPLLKFEYFFLVLLAFSIGVILPFILIGSISGSLSNLTRGAYKHKAKIRAFSGLVLIGYAIYIIVHTI
jgi:cytochrome c biogenesis protein CcdA